MRNLILLAALSSGASASLPPNKQATMQFQHDQWVGYVGEVPDTRVLFDLDDGRPDVQDFTNLWTFKLFKYSADDGVYVFKQWVIGWEYRYLPHSYANWELSGAGDYRIDFEIEVEHNHHSHPLCNAKSDCYKEDPNKIIEYFNDSIYLSIHPSLVVTKPPEPAHPDVPTKDEPGENESPGSTVSEPTPIPPLTTPDDTAPGTPNTDMDEGRGAESEPIPNTVPPTNDPLPVDPEVVTEEPVTVVSIPASTDKPGGAIMWLLGLPLLLRRKYDN